MGILEGFHSIPDPKAGNVSAINRNAIEKEEKRKRAEEARIVSMIKSGMTREEAEAKIAGEEAEILRKMIEQYPPNSGDQSRAA